MPTIDVNRYTQPFYFSYSLPQSFNAEVAQMVKSIADAAGDFASWKAQEEQTADTKRLLAAGMTPGDIIARRTTGRQPKARMTPKDATKMVDEHLDLYGYKPYSAANDPQRARTFLDRRSKLAKLALVRGLNALPEDMVAKVMGTDMRSPDTRKPREVTRGRAVREADDLLDFYGIVPTKAQELNNDFMRRFNDNRSYLSRYLLAAGGEAPEEVVKSIMQGSRPELPAEPTKATNVATPPPTSPAEAIANDVRQGAVPPAPGVVKQKAGESDEQFRVRQTAERDAARKAAITEAKGITIDVAIPGTDQTRKVKLQGGIALAASKLPPEQLDEMAGFLYDMQQAGTDPATMQQFLNIIAHPERVQHLLRRIQDARSRQEARAAAEAQTQTGGGAEAKRSRPGGAGTAAK